MSQPQPIARFQAQQALQDRKAIPGLLEAMERMSDPDLDALAPIVFDVVKLKNQPCAAAALKRIFALRPAWIDQVEEEYYGDSGSNTVLQAAVWLGRMELVDLLLDAGAKTHHVNQLGMGVLDVAACLEATPRRQKALAEVLLQKGEFTQQQKNRALHRAAAKGNLALTRSLLAHGACVGDGFGSTATHSTALAAACSNVGFDYTAQQIVGALLATASGRTVIDHGWGRPCAAPLHDLADKGVVEVMAMMIAAGASVNAPIGLPSANPDTPLMAAASGAHPEAIAMLLAAGADASALDADGGNALHHLANSGVISLHPGQEMRCIELLVGAGAQPFLKDRNGQSPLDIARERERGVVTSTLEAIVSSKKLRSSTALPAKAKTPTGPRF